MEIINKSCIKHILRLVYSVVIIQIILNTINRKIHSAVIGYVQIALPCLSLAILALLVILEYRKDPKNIHKLFPLVAATAAVCLLLDILFYTANL